MFVSGVILIGEIRCSSLLGVKVLKRINREHARMLHFFLMEIITRVSVPPKKKKKAQQCSGEALSTSETPYNLHY